MSEGGFTGAYVTMWGSLRIVMSACLVSPCEDAPHERVIFSMSCSRTSKPQPHTPQSSKPYKPYKPYKPISPEPLPSLGFVVAAVANNIALSIIVATQRTIKGNMSTPYLRSFRKKISPQDSLTANMSIVDLRV